MSLIHRKKSKKDSFTYSNATSDDIKRIKKLGIPPQWENVTIAKDLKEKIQATGYDSKKRKQYIYHPTWVVFSKQEKFSNIDNFNYSKYSRVINNYIKKKDLSKECVICNMLKIMEDLNIRVGNDVYLRENKSIGLTTLMKKHLSGNKLNFIGKKGVPHSKVVKNVESMEFIKRVLRVPGKFLFYYKSGNDIKGINPSDLNSFIKDNIQDSITCKDIRTYSANILFLNFMRSLGNATTEKQKKANITAGLKHVAENLGNTPKVCRDAYISPVNISKFS
jgi:DNA topoisomerase I